jgi:colanic acid/amylovoran biosynthesis glycosyltransferase
MADPTGTDRSSPRVLAVATRFPWRSETFIERKVRALRAAGIDITVAAPWIYAQDPALEPVPTIQLPQPRDPRTWRDALRAVARDGDARQLAPEVLRHHREGLGLVPIVAGRFDIVHLEFSGIAVTLRHLLPHLRPAKLVVSCRGHAEQIAPLFEPERRDHLAEAFAQVDLVHCVSDDMAATVRELGAPEERILVNRPAVDTARWSGVGRVDPTPRGTAEAPLRVLSTGRLHWKKGFDDAIRAVAAARDAGLHVRYRIAGQGPEEEKLEFLRHTLGVTSEVELLGWCDQARVEAELREADAFWLPSLSEGISNSALEGLAAGVPTLSTTCGGMDEVITSGDEGLLVEVGDVAAMAAGLAELADPERRRTLAEGGAARARGAFDLARQAQVFADAYRDLVAR